MTTLAKRWSMARSARAEGRRSAGRAFRVEEAAFLPAALEIIERPVSPTARVTSWVLLVGLAATIAWLMLGRIDVVVSAQGSLVPAGSVRIVQPSEAGIVRAILVQDGQRVRRGEALLELDTTVSEAELTQAERALETAELDAARARAILSGIDGRGFDYRAPDGAKADVIAVSAALARAQLADVSARDASQAADRERALATLAEAQRQVAKLSETLPLLDEQISANEQLLKQGYVSRLRVLEMRRQRIAAAGDRDIALESVRRARAELASASQRGSQSTAEARARILGDLEKSEAEVRLRREELVKARQRSRLQTLRSPVDGTVSQLSVHTVGGVVDPSKPIMIIVPRSEALVADVVVLNKDIGFVKAGQRVVLKLQAFPFTRHGTVHGTIERIGADAVQDEKLGLVYRARVALESQTIGRDSPMTPLAAGMSLTADIRTGERSIFSYLISPIDEVTHEAGRER
ncbi:HlyD family type I secretion periplasmic adaptor subunit [Sphingomonas sp. HF-S3]|uniref:Membrane fusion protein (MFP) family protein n=1 Tax=Sphingomonas rustica TaxID=3103142 RepID=A0ABV0B6F5_9SPHN